MSEQTMPTEIRPLLGEPRGFWSWVTTTNHKRIGLLYMSTSIAFFVVAAGFAMLMRAQLMGPNQHLISAETYNQIISMHGTTMIFLFAMPMLGGGFANYLIPLMIGAKDMAFPRLNALSYWLFLFGGILLYSSFIFGGALDTGWYSYSPLTSSTYSPHAGVTFWIAAILLVGASSVLGAINFLITMIKLRAPGMTFLRMPLFALTTFINSMLILLAIPSLTAALSMLYLDRTYGAVFFEARRGGDPIVWQHLFWFFGHPEVYVLILPAFGILSEVVPVFSRKPLFGRSSMIVMVGIIGFLSFTVWAHHMFAVGLPSTFNAVMAATSMLIAIPTGVKIFNWLATMWGGSLRFRVPFLFCLGFIGLFVVGGLTGVMQAAVPFDLQATHTFFIVAHLHNVLFGGTVMAIFAGVYYWFPKMTGRFLGERLGKLHFWLILVGISLTFLPMYALGLMGMPRRFYTYAADQGWNTLNLISSLGGFLIGIAITVFIVNLVRSLRREATASDNPWEAWTLEWATPSPPPSYNFVSLPAITSERPLWDWAQGGLVVEAAGGFEAAGGGADFAAGGPGEPPEAGLRAGGGGHGHAAADAAAAAAAESAIALSPPEHSTPVPILAALATLSLAAGLILKLPIVALVGGAYVLVFMGFWMWSQWPEPELLPAPGTRYSQIGAGMLTFIASESVFFGCLIYTYLHLRVHLGVWPPPGMPRLPLTIASINTVVLVSSGFVAHRALVFFRNGRERAFRLALFLTMALGVGFLGGQAWEYTHAGFGLSSGLLGSVFFTLTGFHGAHVTVGLLILAYLYVRTLRDKRLGLSSPSQGTTGMLEAGTYYWHFVDAVWVVLFCVLYLL